MLFILGDSLVGIDKTNIRHSRALEVILGAYQARDHLVFIDIETAKRISVAMEGSISFSSKVALAALKNKAVEQQHLCELIDYKVIIYLDPAKERGMYREKMTWHVPLEYFAESGLIQTAILGENEADSDFYLQLALHYKAKHQYHGIHVKGRAKTGGGSGIPKSLAAYLRDELSPCLCITDSDKFHPKFGESKTSKKCRRISQVRNRVVEYITLEEREVENLVPIPLLEKTTPIADSFLPYFREYILMEPDHWRYIDLKDGISLKWLQSKDEQTRKYWKKAEEHFTKKSKMCRICVANDTKHPEKCSCKNIPGLGDNILTSCVNYLKEGKHSLNLRLLRDDSRWEDIAKIVFDFAIAPTGELIA